MDESVTHQFKDSCFRKQMIFLYEADPALSEEGTPEFLTNALIKAFINLKDHPCTRGFTAFEQKSDNSRRSLFLDMVESFRFRFQDFE